MRLFTSRLAAFFIILFCQVGNTQTNDATDVTHKFEKFDYVGELKDGQPNGYGITTWTVGSAQGATVEGIYANGRPAAGEYHTIRWPNGDVYFGQLKGWKRDGFGVLELLGIKGKPGLWQRKPTVYEGMWSGDKRDGAGMEWASSNFAVNTKYKKTQGTWSAGKLHGFISYYNISARTVHEARANNGRLHCRSDFVNGRDDGKESKTLCYHSNGKLSTIFAYDSSYGARRMWSYDNSGQLEEVCNYNGGDCRKFGGTASAPKFDWFRAMNQQINDFNRSYESGAIRQELDSMDSIRAEAERAARLQQSSMGSNSSSATPSDGEYPSCRITTPCGVRTGTLVNGKCWLEARCGGPSN